MSPTPIHRPLALRVIQLHLRRSADHADQTPAPGPATPMRWRHGPAVRRRQAVHQVEAITPVAHAYQAVGETEVDAMLIDQPPFKIQDFAPLRLRSDSRHRRPA